MPEFFKSSEGHMKVSEHTQSMFVPSLSSCEPRFGAFATFRLFFREKKRDARAKVEPSEGQTVKTVSRKGENRTKHSFR